MTRTIEAQICLRCGVLEWVIMSSRYRASYRVMPDGHVKFEEDMEYYCGNYGLSVLLGIEGSPKTFRELVRAEVRKTDHPALKLIAEEKLEVTDDFTPEEVLEFIEDDYASCLKDEASKRFLSEAVKIIERWKMIED